jgi:hypothetical protein
MLWRIILVYPTGEEDEVSYIKASILNLPFNEEDILVEKQYCRIYVFISWNRKNK